jgi:hypothetical protein
MAQSVRGLPTDLVQEHAGSLLQLVCCVLCHSMRHSQCRDMSVMSQYWLLGSDIKCIILT